MEVCGIYAVYGKTFLLKNGSLDSCKRGLFAYLETV